MMSIMGREVVEQEVIVAEVGQPRFLVKTHLSSHHLLLHPRHLHHLHRHRRLRHLLQ